MRLTDMSRTSSVLLRTQSDERLVALARAGHDRAFETIVRRYRRPLLAACRRMVDDGRAEDVLQQALLSAWAALRRGDDVRELRAWLFRIVRNAAVSHGRRSGHDSAELVDTLSVAASPQEEAERRAVVQETLETIAGLPPRQREALLRISVQGHSQDEVAEELGVSRIAVRQLVHRARTSLRATATAVFPLPLMSWAAGAGTGESLSLRIGSLIAGAGGAGAAATFAKAGVVAGVAATAVSAPMIVEHRPATRSVAIAATATPTPTTARTARPAPSAAPATAAPTSPTTVAVSAPAGHTNRPATTVAVKRRTTSGGGANAGQHKRSQSRPAVPRSDHNGAQTRSPVAGDDDEQDGSAPKPSTQRSSDDDAKPSRTTAVHKDDSGDSSDGDSHVAPKSTPVPVATVDDSHEADSPEPAKTPDPVKTPDPDETD
jgi:RNA polymerase sigma factor (sigma-70 family)